MTAHFKKSELSVQAVRRLCRERIDKARDWLRQSNRARAIHELRKEIKRLRATLRLVEEDVSKNDYRKATKGLRVTAKSLAASRDARVMLKAFEELTGDRAQRFAGVRKKLREHHRREMRRSRKSDVVAKLDRRLGKVKRRVKELKLRKDGWAAVEPGLRRTYERGRMAWKGVCRSPLPEYFHDWRKQIKCLSYHLEMLCPAWPVETRAILRGLEKLGELLGEDHDLVMLCEFASKHSASFPREAAALERMIKAREKKLRAVGLKLGASLYAKTPSEFCRRLGKEWNDWRGTGGCH